MKTKITLIEFKAAPNSLNEKTLDSISYPMIKNNSLPLTGRLINLYNNIQDSHIPQQFQNSLIVPIHKPILPKSVVPYRLTLVFRRCLTKSKQTHSGGLQLSSSIVDSSVFERACPYLNTNSVRLPDYRSPINQKPPLNY